MITVFEFGCKDVVRVRVCLFVIRQKNGRGSVIVVIGCQLVFGHDVWATAVCPPSLADAWSRCTPRETCCPALYHGERSHGAGCCKHINGVFLSVLICPMVFFSWQGRGSRMRTRCQTRVALETRRARRTRWQARVILRWMSRVVLSWYYGGNDIFLMWCRPRFSADFAKA